MTEKVIIKPQPGPQTKFMRTPADIAIYGGAAGGGKSFGLLMEPLRHSNNKKFGGVVFRRSTVQVRNEGGLWDESVNLYGMMGAEPLEYKLEWTFRSGMRMKFAHLENESTVLDWQGSQIPYIGFDELTHFTEKQFFYMLSRNRSTSGVSGYVRATCNPDADSWVARLISWWIDPVTGLADKERAAKVRWFIRLNDEIHWANSKDEIYERFGKGPEVIPKSLTFIPSSIYDNKILMDKDPAYLANLNALSKVDRARLKDGNWKIRPSAGNYFRREWFEVVDAIPSGWTQIIRFWDRAATKPNPTNPNPDWTRGLKLYKYPNGTWVVADIRSMQDTPLAVETLIKNTASFDGPSVQIMSQQDPGSAGVAEAGAFVRMLQGYNVQTMTTSKDKETRAKPVSAQCEHGNVKVLRGTWNEDFFNELENFPEGAHDDQVDVLSGAFNALATNGSILDLFR